MKISPKNLTTKQIALGLACISLTACHIDGNVLMGGHSNGYGYDQGYATSAASCSYSGTFNTTSTSGSTGTCQVPDEFSLLSVSSVSDGTLHIQVQKLTDGTFPNIQISYQERSVSSPHSIGFSCAAAAGAPASTGSVFEVVCTPQTSAHVRWFETSSQDIHLQLSNLMISDSACGSTKSWLYQGNYGSSCIDSTVSGGAPGSQIGSVFFPDLYLDGTSP